MKTKKGKFMNTCPVSGGVCLNPFCAFGCIENTIVETRKVKPIIKLT